MHRFIFNSIINFFKSNFTNSFDVLPVVVTYHFTHRCNLQCFFCEACGIDKNERWQREGELDTDSAKKLLKMLSGPFAFLYITGGEPFLRSDAVELFEFIGGLPFKNVTVNTNLTIMERIEKCLPVIDNLVVSIDSINPEHLDSIRGVKGCGKKILNNFEKAIDLQSKYKYRLHVNCVVTPSTINDAREVLKYCMQRGVKVGINAQNDKHGPIKELINNSDFKNLIIEVMQAKERTRLVNGTKMYYEQMWYFQKYDCYPFLTPRINAKGDLAYPCDNLNQWVPNITQYSSWKAVMRRAIEMYGRIPKCELSCQFQCYIEPSMMVKKPWMVFKEYL